MKGARPSVLALMAAALGISRVRASSLAQFGELTPEEVRAARQIRDDLATARRSNGVPRPRYRGPRSRRSIRLHGLSRSRRRAAKRWNRRRS